MNQAESVDLSALTIPVAQLYKQVDAHPNTPYLHQPRAGQTHVLTWRETGDQVAAVAGALKALGLAPGSRIALLSKNCAEWFITDLAIMLAGYISVPIFPTASPDTIQYVLEHADCKALFFGKLDEPEIQRKAIPDGLTTLGFIETTEAVDQTWEQLLASEPFRELPTPSMDDTATIIYTSGSTGKPKGVVHTFGSLSWTGSECIKALDVNNADRLMSYLPLAHITERVLVEIASLYAGTQIFFVESLDTFTRDVKACQPTLFISVPRLWTRFQMGVLAKIPQKKLSIMLSIPILGGMVAKKIREQLGIGQARLWASGSAPLSPAIIKWFHRIGINISEGWGMSENAAYGTSCVPFRIDKAGCIGLPYPGVDIRISDEGEIQAKGPCNMKEYYLDEEKTREVFTDDGYLRTGDKGAVDADGYIKITGRLKDIFKTAKGKYVAPVPIEAQLMENPLIEQVCVTGNDLKQPVALVVIAAESRDTSKEDIKTSLTATLDKVNNRVEHHEELDHVIVVEGEWTIENELLTPTLKVKRHLIEERYDNLIHGSHQERVCWE